MEKYETALFRVFLLKHLFSAWNFRKHQVDTWCWKIMLSFDNGFSCNFLPVFQGPELQILWKLVKIQLTSTELIEYTQIRLRYLFKNKAGCHESIWIVLPAGKTLIFPSEATGKYISSLSHFTAFSYIRPENQSLLQTVFKDTRSSRKSPQWRNAPGFTCHSDKGCTLFHQILTFYSSLKFWDLSFF